MGILVDGRWVVEEGTIRLGKGRFERSASRFRNWVTPDGAAGPSGAGGFAAEPGRYHLYVSLACPWAHRTLILRRLKGLESLISVSVTHYYMAEKGWTFEPGPDVISDTVNGTHALHELYIKADPRVSGRATVPVLWDKKTATIVSNESAEIIRMLNSAFDGCGAAAGDYYPQTLRDEIDALNATVYETVNNGVYKSGFATTQEAYEEAVTALFATLDALEARLAGGRRFLLGDQLTEADIRLYTTLIRFEPVYVGHFKCNIRRLLDYPNLWAYTQALYRWPAFAETTNVMHIKRHYYESHRSLNPTGIVPVGPILDLTEPA